MDEDCWKQEFYTRRDRLVTYLGSNAGMSIYSRHRLDSSKRPNKSMASPIFIAFCLLSIIPLSMVLTSLSISFLLM
ncbi:hypothetical protein CKAN_01814100 [Cinnamomum micranthum f. kanehirae]|uniref:Transmembrane protein n=1 Tax=Cinnamomum micranthum f. kanehirae TaxID=337451 RepID=A0A443PE99_9MAGN|nr:hypothetical protein CKAN_01814100 [Cinnamomum micranthum f. kanehirae]